MPPLFNRTSFLPICHAKPIRRAFLWLGFSSLVLAGCGLPFIQGTKLPATRENQQVYAVVLRYKEAMSKANWADLLQMVSPRFHETRGTPDPADDYGFDSLQEKLTHPDLKKVRVIRYTLDVEKIEYPKPEEALVYVSTRFTYRYPKSSDRVGLDTGPDRHVIVFEFYRGRWMILRGI